MTFKAKWHFSMIDRRPVVSLSMTFWPNRLPRSSFSSILFFFPLFLLFLTYFSKVVLADITANTCRSCAYCLVGTRHGIHRRELNITDRTMLTDSRSFIRG